MNNISSAITIPFLMILSIATSFLANSVYRYNDLGYPWGAIAFALLMSNLVTAIIFLVLFIPAIYLFTRSQIVAKITASLLAGLFVPTFIPAIYLLPYSWQIVSSPPAGFRVLMILIWWPALAITAACEAILILSLRSNNWIASSLSWFAIFGLGVIGLVAIILCILTATNASVG